jgi:DNA-binding transcriptional LysR family regulator
MPIGPHLCFESMDVELRELRCFLAVAEELHFTRAAEQLHLTQPALSRTVQRLEDTLRATLLDRTTRAVALTGAGERLRDELRDLLPRLDAALRSVSAGAVLRLGFAWALPDGWASDLLPRFEQETGTRVELVRRDGRFAGLERGEADVALVRGLRPRRGLRVLRLFDEPRVAAVASVSPLARRRRLAWNELAAWPLVVNVVSGTTTPALWPAECRPAVGAEVRNTDEWLEAIAANRGVGSTPRSTTAMYRHPGVRYVALRDAPEVPVHLAWPARGAHPQASAFVAAARAFVRSEGLV